MMRLSVNSPGVASERPKRIEMFDVGIQHTRQDAILQSRDDNWFTPTHNAVSLLQGGSSGEHVKQKSEQKFVETAAQRLCRNGLAYS